MLPDRSFHFKIIAPVRKNQTNLGGFCFASHQFRILVPEHPVPARRISLCPMPASHLGGIDGRRCLRQRHAQDFRKTDTQKVRKGSSYCAVPHVQRHWGPLISRIHACHGPNFV